MASRTISTTKDVDAALDFLGRQQDPPITGDQVLTTRVQELVTAALAEADEARFNKAAELLQYNDKSEAIAMLRELLQ
jgi:hypothetical protein